MGRLTKIISYGLIFINIYSANLNPISSNLGHTVSCLQHTTIQGLSLIIPVVVLTLFVAAGEAIYMCIWLGDKTSSMFLGFYSSVQKRIQINRF